MNVAKILLKGIFLCLMIIIEPLWELSYSAKSIKKNARTMQAKTSQL